MKYIMYQLRFPTGVHFGRNSLEESEQVFRADTLFSALYIEALKQGTKCADKILEDVSKERLLLTDAFPYIDDVVYLPKPYKRIHITGEVGDSVLKKAYKGLGYVPMNKMDEYLQGKLNVLEEGERLKQLGHSVLKMSASVTGREETEPYQIGVYYYRQNAGLHFIAGFQDPETEAQFVDLLDAVSFAGIGGKKTLGFGRFEVIRQVEIEPSRFEKTNSERGYMLLSTALPAAEDLDKALSSAEGYQMQERGGFVASDHYASEQRKKDKLYVFQAGSCFAQKFSGEIFDLSNEGGSHPVYRYAKALFWAL